MTVYYRFQKEAVLPSPAIFTFGTFDGVHLGHRHIFDKQFELARAEKQPTALLTFSNHPTDVLTPATRSRWLTSNAQKLKELQGYGFDAVIDVPFTAQLQSLTREQFLQLVQTMVPFSTLVVGEDVAFGKDRKGDKSFLKKQGFSTVFVDKVSVDGTVVSSSEIRQAIAAARFDEAERLLGRPYCIDAKRSGDAEWDSLYFALPPQGIYLADIRYNDQKEWHEAGVKISSCIEIDERNSDSHSVEIQLKKRKS